MPQPTDSPDLRAPVWLRAPSADDTAAIDATVHVSERRVGTLAPANAERLRSARATAAARDDLPWALSRLTRLPPGAGFVLELPAPGPPR